MPVNLVNMGGGGSVGFGNALNQRRQNRILQELGRAPLSQRNQSDDLLPILALILQLQSQKEGQGIRRDELGLAEKLQKGQLGIQQGQFDLTKQLTEFDLRRSTREDNMGAYMRELVRSQGQGIRGGEARGRQVARFGEDIGIEREEGEFGGLVSSLNFDRMLGALDQGPATAKSLQALGTGIDEYLPLARNDLEELFVGGASRASIDALLDEIRGNINIAQAFSGGAGKDVPGAGDLDRRFAGIVTGLDKFEEKVGFDPRTVKRGMEDIQFDAEQAQRDASQTRLDKIWALRNSSNFAEEIANLPYDLDDPPLDFSGIPGGGPILQADMAGFLAAIREAFGGGQAGGVGPQNPTGNPLVARAIAEQAAIQRAEPARFRAIEQQREFEDFTEAQDEARRREESQRLGIGTGLLRRGGGFQ